MERKNGNGIPPKKKFLAFRRLTKDGKAVSALKNKESGGTYLYKSVFVIAVVSVCPVLLMAILMNYQMSKTAERELSESNAKILTFLKNAVETEIKGEKNSLRILQDEKIFGDFQNLEMPALWYESKNKFDSDEELLKIYHYIQIKQGIFARMESEKRGNDFIDSVYYIDYKNSVVLTCKREFFAIKDFYDQDVFLALRNRENAWGVTERIQTRVMNDQSGEYLESINLLTFYCYALSPERSKLFIINLDAGRFYDYLNKNIFKNNEGEFTIMKNDGYMLKPTGDWPVKTDEINRLEKSKTHSWRAVYNNADFFITAQYSPALDWWFISRTDGRGILNTKTYTMKILLAASAVLVVIVLTTALLVSLNLLKPIVLERDSLRRRISRLMPFFREKYVLSLLEGKAVNQNDLELNPDSMPPPLVPGPYYVLLIKAESVESGANRETGGSGMTGLLNTLEITSRCIFSFTPRAMAIPGEFDYIIVILNKLKDENFSVFTFARTLWEKLSSGSREHFLLGISREHENFETLPAAYSEAREAFSYSVFFPGNPVTYINDIQAGCKKAPSRYFELPLSFFTALRAGRGDEAIGQLLAHFRTVGTGNTEGAALRVSDVFIYLLSKLLDLTEEVNGLDEEAAGKLSRINRNLLQHDDLAALENIKDYIRGLAVVYREGMKKRNDSRLNRVKEILEKNFSSSAISLSSTAEAVGFNPDYLGKIFREETGISFVDYLTSLRINKSLELLKTTEMRIKEISFAVGYNNPNYFIRIFRERLGITPGEYRSNS
jgi:AraC-like DNA-binding protein